MLFSKEASHYEVLKRCAEFVDKSCVLRVGLGAVEDLCKLVLFNCRKCGDCALPDMAFLCPESQCPKFIRNGACGGSEKGRCEVRKDKMCVWVKVYERLKARHEEAKLKGRCIAPRNWSLAGTSSWLNFYLDRDYHGWVLPQCDRRSV
jgi:methylenetetrahydrofolate reductase (NADPH)